MTCLIFACDTQLLTVCSVSALHFTIADEGSSFAETHHGAASVTSRFDHGPDGGQVLGCAGTSRDDLDNKPQDQDEGAGADGKRTLRSWRW